MSDVMEEIKQDDMIESDLGSVYFGLTPKWPEGARYQSKTRNQAHPTKRSAGTKNTRRTMVANRRDNRGRPGWLGHAKKVEKANGMGEADYRGLMALGRSSIAFPGQWDTTGGGFTPRNNITWFIFLRRLWLLCGKWIVQRGYCSHSNKRRRLRQIWGIFQKACSQDRHWRGHLVQRKAKEGWVLGFWLKPWEIKIAVWCSFFISSPVGELGLSIEPALLLPNPEVF